MSNKLFNKVAIGVAALGLATQAQALGVKRLTPLALGADIDVTDAQIVDGIGTQTILSEAMVVGSGVMQNELEVDGELYKPGDQIGWLYAGLFPNKTTKDFIPSAAALMEGKNAIMIVGHEIKDDGTKRASLSIYNMDDHKITWNAAPLSNIYVDADTQESLHIDPLSADALAVSKNGQVVGVVKTAEGQSFGVEWNEIEVSLPLAEVVNYDEDTMLDQGIYGMSGDGTIRVGTQDNAFAIYTPEGVETFRIKQPSEQSGLEVQESLRAISDDGWAAVGYSKTNNITDPAQDRDYDGILVKGVNGDAPKIVKLEERAFKTHDGKPYPRTAFSIPNDVSGQDAVVVVGQINTFDYSSQPALWNEEGKLFMLEDVLWEGAKHWNIKTLTSISDDFSMMVGIEKSGDAILITEFNAANMYALDVSYDLDHEGQKNGIITITSKMLPVTDYNVMRSTDLVNWRDSGVDVDHETKTASLPLPASGSEFYMVVPEYGYE